MRKQVYSFSTKPELMEAVDGAVKYCKYKSRSSLIEMAIEEFLTDLHETLLKENKDYED